MNLTLEQLMRMEKNRAAALARRDKINRDVEVNFTYEDARDQAPIVDFQPLRMNRPSPKSSPVNKSVDNMHVEDHGQAAPFNDESPAKQLGHAMKQSKISQFLVKTEPPPHQPINISKVDQSANKEVSPNKINQKRNLPDDDQISPNKKSKTEASSTPATPVSSKSAPSQTQVFFSLATKSPTAPASKSFYDELHSSTNEEFKQVDWSMDSEQTNDTAESEWINVKSKRKSLTKTNDSDDMTVASSSNSKAPINRSSSALSANSEDNESSMKSLVDTFSFGTDDFDTEDSNQNSLPQATYQKPEPKKKKRRSAAGNQTITQMFSQIPEGSTVIATTDELRALSSKLESADRVCWGVTWKNDTTNFRVNRMGKKANEEDILNVNEEVIGISFIVDKKDELYFLSFEETGTDFDSMKWQIMREFIESKSTLKVCYNAQRSLCPVFTHFPYYDVEPSNIFDPKVGSWVVEPELDKQNYDFPELVFFFLRKILNIPDLNSHQIHKDLLLCDELADHIKGLLQQQQLMSAFYHEMRVVPIMARMEIEGIGFDNTFLQQYRQSLLNRLDELQRQAEAIVGHPVSLMSPKQVAEVIYNELQIVQEGSKQSMTASKKQMSTSEKVLKTLGEKHPFPNIVREYRHIQKHLSNWIDSLEKFTDNNSHALDANKYCHGTICLNRSCKIVNAINEKFSDMRQNLQNLPKNALFLSLDDEEEPNEGAVWEEDDDEEEPKPTEAGQSNVHINIRNAFCSKPGFTLLAADYSQIEFRILAHMTQDRHLLDFFNSNNDIHSQIASRWLAKPIDQVTKQERDYSKRIVYGILYGMGAPALAGMLKISVPQAEKFISTFLGKFPNVAQFLEMTVKRARRTGEVRTLLNRVRKLPGINNQNAAIAKRAERQAVNSVIQGSAADLVKLAMIRIDELIKKNENDIGNNRLLLQIHDELVFEVDDKNLDKMVQVVKTAMESVFADLLVPLTVTMSHGKRWGDLKSIDLTDVKPALGIVAREHSGSALQQQDVHVSPKQTVQTDAELKLLKVVKSEPIQPPAVKEKVAIEQHSSSVGLDDELESILSEFSVPEGDELPNDEELMSIFDLCNTPV